MSNGIAIALAWPETYCKQPGSWYDSFMRILRMNKNGYYKVGHAAVLLINKRTGECHYFDFGRYHSPFGTGRVRSKQTDHELIVPIQALFDRQGKLTNYRLILDYLANHVSCHGTGVLHAGTLSINFEKAHTRVLLFQNESPLPYGPFLINGTNCSRFVRSVIIAGAVKFRDQFRLSSAWIISPTPISNVRILQQRIVVHPTSAINLFEPRKRNKSFFKETLPTPPLPDSLPKSAQWLAGEGAGSWFVISKTANNSYLIRRFDQDGLLECQGVGYDLFNRFDPEMEFKLCFPSDCTGITVIQNGIRSQLIL